MKNKEKRIFLDYASITPVDLSVAKEMTKIQKDFWANPSSLHTEGERAKNILEEARIRIARILHCKASEVFFTASGTESLNIAILGICREDVILGTKPKADFGFALPHIIVSTIEHPAVLEPIKYLLKEGKAEVSFITPNEKGIINPDSIKKIAKVIREYKSTRTLLVQNKLLVGPYLLVDASQSVLYENVSLERLGADLLVLDGIKIYGPRGMGLLVVKTGVKISPIIFGGGQEGGLRSGTENVVAVAGLAKALEIATKKREKESKSLTKLRDYAITEILKEIPNTSLNGDLENRLPNNINICFASPKLSAKSGFQKIDSEFLVIKLDTLGFAVSAASACHALSLENGSYVIEAVSNKECASSSLRITLGRNTKKSDLDSFISALKKIVK